MKAFISVFSLVIVGMLCSAALADMQNGPLVTRESNAIFKAQAATGTSAINSNVTRMFGNVRATAVFTGMSSNNGGTTNTQTTNISGPATLYCGLSASGPWAPMKDSLGNVVTLANGGAFTVFDLNSLCNFVRGTWTPAAISTNRTLYLYLLGAD